MEPYNIASFSKPHLEKLKKIKVFLVDCDGILTNGLIYWSGEEVGWNRYFNVSDGYGFKVLRLAGLEVGVISGGNSLGVQKRCENMKVHYAYLGNEDKRQAFLDIEKKSGVKPEEILYMGDEHFDIPLLKRAGFSATVDVAAMAVQKASDYVTTKKAGYGAVREVIDMVCYAQDLAINIPDFE
jgi:3-deoxy-D-manno-octulosonate 8-phosphate phosphatase (KDO 8-P phosphatase)